jgi:hypothetical protein
MLDRLARLCIGIVLAVFGAFIVTGAIGIVLLVPSIPLPLSAIVGFCPTYVPFGIRQNDSIRVAEIVCHQ